MIQDGRVVELNIFRCPALLTADGLGSCLGQVPLQVANATAHNAATSATITVNDLGSSANGTALGNASGNVSASVNAEDELETDRMVVDIVGDGAAVRNHDV